MNGPRSATGRVVFGLAVGGALLAGMLARPEAPNAGDGIPLLEVRESAIERHVGAEGTLRPVRSTALSPPVGGPLKLEWTLPNGSHVEQGELIARFAGSELQKNLADGRSDLESARARLAKENALVSSAERARQRAAALSRAELEHAQQQQNQDETLFSRHQIIESGIDEQLSLLRSEHANRAERIESAISHTRIDLLAVDERRADLAIARAEKGLNGLELRAPHAGVVVFADSGRGQPFQVGDSVWAGQTLATLPDLSEMEALVYVLAADAGGVAVGKGANVVVEAHPETRVEASVKHVETLAKPLVPSNPTQYFAVTLELGHTDPRVMKPGARVHANLHIDELRGLVVPRHAVFDRAGKLVVYVRRAERFESVDVQLGAISLGRAVVTSGLRAGDRIALIDPERNQPVAPDTDGASAPSAASALGASD